MNDAPELTSVSRQLTVDDLKQKALHIRDLAESETREVLQRDATKVLAIGVVAVLAAVSIAYFLGARRSCCTADDLM